MSSGYSDDNVDFDEFFEPWEAGDPKQPPTSISVVGVDFSDRYVHVSAGSPYPQNVGAGVVGVDFSNLFAAKLSVPRYPDPLPWSMSTDVNVAVYRQPSRPTLSVTASLGVTIRREGTVSISRSMPVYNSTPGQVVQEHLYTTSDPALWSDAGASPNSPYQVRFDHISGPQPVLANGHSLGQWITLNTTPFSATLTNGLTYTNNAIHGLKTANSQVRISVRRSNYPDSNKADAVLTTSINLDVEPSVYSDNGWGGTHTASNDSANNNWVPEGNTATYHAAVRIVFANNGTYQIQRATWTNSATPSWTNIKTATWLRSGFSISDYELLVTDPTSGLETSHSIASWLAASTTRILTVTQSTGNGTSPGTYSKSVPATVRIREISTRNWPGLPDNFTENSFTLAPSVQIQQALEPQWRNLSAMSGPFIDETEFDQDPNDSTTVTRRIRLQVRSNGQLRFFNNAGTELQVVTWLPNGFNVSDFEVRVVAAGANNNPLSGWTTISSDTNVILALVARAMSSDPGTYTHNQSFSFQIRRAAFTTHSQSQSGSAVARIIVNEMPQTLFPGEHDNWAGTYTLNSSTEPFEELDNWAGYTDMTHTFQKQNSGSSQVGQSLLLRTDGARRIRFRNMVHYTNSLGNLVFVHPKEPMMLALKAWLPMTDFEWRVMRFDQSNVNTIIPSLAANTWSGWMEFGSNPEHSQGLVGYMTRTEPVTYSTSTYVLDHKAYYRVQIRHKTITSIITEGYVYMDGTVFVT